jgi:AcrR family transcriptional regulator
MEADDELWPPFGPGAEFRQGSGRPGPLREDGRPERQDADRRGQAGDWRRQQNDRRAQQEATERRRTGAGRPPFERHRGDFEERAAEFQRRLAELDQRLSGGEGRVPGPAPRGRDRHRPVLSRDDIVAAAISIADRFGAEAVSMRKIAQLLQAGAMSLYWHLASKEHLIELMLDAIQGEIYVPEPTGDWRADLRANACSVRSVLIRHRWVIDFFGSRPPLGPNTLRGLDKVLAMFDGLDIDLATAINAVQAVNTYVSGAVIRELQEIRTQREQDEVVSADNEYFEKLAEWKQRLAESGKFGRFIRMLEDDIDPDSDDTRDERFEFGLDCLLEGIAVRIAKDGDQPGSASSTRAR